MLGEDAPEIMQGLSIAINCGATKADFDRTVGIHPTAAEEFVTLRTRTRVAEGTAAEPPDEVMRRPRSVPPRPGSAAERL